MGLRIRDLSPTVPDKWPGMRERIPRSEVLLTKLEYDLCLQPYTASPTPQIGNPQTTEPIVSFITTAWLLRSGQCRPQGFLLLSSVLAIVMTVVLSLNDGHRQPKQIEIRLFLSNYLKVKLYFQHSTKWLIPAQVLGISCVDRESVLTLQRTKRFIWGLKNCNLWEFPGGLVFGIRRCHCRGLGSIPGGNLTSCAASPKL